MDAVGTMGGPVGIAVRVVFLVLALVALYYLYQYLYGSTGLESVTLHPGIKLANMDAPVVVEGKKLPSMYEGGEYSVNFWMYINDYAVRRGFNKHVLSLGSSDPSTSSFTTLLVYLSPFKSNLNVRVQTTTPGAAVSGSASASPQSSSMNLVNTQVSSMFNTQAVDSGLLEGTCDVESVELQKWLQVTVVLNNKTCDVYVDGKLKRSCVLPSFYKVDPRLFVAKLCDFKGFGGYMGPTTAYNYALNPDEIWRLYMSGPGPQYGAMDWLKSLFDPKAIGSLEYPKMN